MKSRRGFSLIELVIVIAVILIIVTIAVPNYRKQQLLANEASVLSEMQTFYVAQTQFLSQYGRYASSAGELGPPVGLISKTLAAGSHHGYSYTVTGTASGFTVSAVPLQFGSSGSRTFFMDETRTVHQNSTAEPATAESPEVP
jgi:type IV pilus assembly protein PilA